MRTLYRCIVLLFVLSLTLTPVAIMADESTPTEETQNIQPYTPDSGDYILPSPPMDDQVATWVTIYYVSFAIVFLWLYATGWLRIEF